MDHSGMRETRDRLIVADLGHRTSAKQVELGLTDLEVPEL